MATRQSPIVEQFLVAMRTAYSFGAHTAETTFYTPLSNLLNAVGERLKPRVVFVAHPGNRGAGLPDGGHFAISNRRPTAPLPNQRPERGVVEVKSPVENLATLAQSEQVLRYLREYGLCLITNYHQFQLVELRQGRPSVMESYDLTRTADDLWNTPLNTLVKRHGSTLPDFLARVLTRKVPLTKPKDVAELLASYAREARERSAEHPIVAFDGVKSALQESLGITFEGKKGEHFFRSTLIQTLFYGIFSAWILWRRSPDYSDQNGTFNWRLSAEYLRVAVLRTLFHAVAEPGALNSVQITEVLDHATDALNRVQADFFGTFREEDAVQYFYEPFLQAFDPILRKDLGVWYTPREIVRYMVRRIDFLLRSELNEPLGLASPRVQVLDPCCGTGAYLVEVLHCIERTLRTEAGDDDAFVGSDLRLAATTRVFGFEIMPAPFVIAHLQIAQLLEDKQASLTAAQRAQVFLTNALTGWIPARHPQANFGFPAFAQERDAAEAVKQADTILVILGNPPYNGYAGIASIEEERDLTNAYRAAVPGMTAPQGKGLNDLYIRFFRIAERRIVGDAHVKGNLNHRGLISFISNNAWLDGLSHVSMRDRLLQEFQAIYVDNLNGDKYRTGKKTPEGKPDPSAFTTPQNREGIQVGTAVSTFIRSSPGPSGRKIALREFWGATKLAKLAEDAKQPSASRYELIEPKKALGLSFANRSHSLSYLEWPSLPALFSTSFAGAQTARDSALVDIDATRLEMRILRYLDSEIDDTLIRAEMPALMRTKKRFNSPLVRRALLARGFKPWQVRRFAYRPFDVRWVYWEPTTKLLDEKREDFVRCVPLPCEILISQQKTRMTASLPQLISVLPDLALMDRGATSFPLKVMDRDATLLNLGDGVRTNLSAAGEKYVSRIGAGELDPFFHALAIMHTPRYRTENAGALLNDWPRIPLPETGGLLSRSATLGRRLAELLDPESDLQLGPQWGFLARLALPPELPEGAPNRDSQNSARFALIVGWGSRGQGETVMPGRGKVSERDWTDAERERISVLAASLNTTLTEALTSLGARCLDIYLNDDSRWTAVPAKVWQYTMGGYQVLKKWLSYREQPLLGRPLHEREARYFSQVVRRITTVLLLGSALNASYEALLPTACGLAVAERETSIA